MSSREVTLEGGGPWGFRMHGGADTKQPLRISRVNPGSKAAQQGVREADLISSINGQSTRNASNVDAHAMLKNAGDTLRLGLNKDVSGSPKKRIYRSIQEIKTETETIKRSSVSSITVSDSTDSQCSPLDRVLSSVHSDRPIVINRDTNNLVNEQNNESISRRFDDISSSGAVATSNDATPAPRTPNTFVADADRPHRDTDQLIIDSEVEVAITNSDDKCNPNYVNNIHSCVLIMSDNASCNAGRSRRTRKRNNKRKNKTKNVAQATSEAEVIEVISDAAVNEQVQEQCDNDKCFKTISDAEEEEPAKSNRSIKTLVSEIASENYRVESPRTVSKVPKKVVKPMMSKSKSLDDEDNVLITEVTGEGGDLSDKSCSFTESVAIVSEAESEVEWETTSDLNLDDESSSSLASTLSGYTISLEDEMQPTSMSREDESSLRTYLGCLNIPPNHDKEGSRQDESFISDEVSSKPPTHDAKEKRARKRADIETHFMPQYINPRFLDVIQEEGSDGSDIDRRLSMDLDRKHFMSENRKFFECQNDELDDDVFVDPKPKEPKESFPKTSLSPVLNHETGERMMCMNKSRVRREQPTVLLGTRIVEMDNKSGCGDWTTKQLDKASGAEVVFIDDTSSNSSVNDHEEVADDADIEDDDDDGILDVKIMTPTIEIDSLVNDKDQLFLNTVLNITEDEVIPNSQAETDREGQSNNMLQSLEDFSSASPDNNDKTEDKIDLKPNSLPSDEQNSVAKLYDINDNKEDKINAEETEMNAIFDSTNAKDENDSVICSLELKAEDEYNRDIQAYENTDSQSPALLTPQDSSSSMCSSRSQSTAKYCPMDSPLSDTIGHVDDDIEILDDLIYVSGIAESATPMHQPKSLRELCVKNVAALPFGSEILEELAVVAESLEDMTNQVPLKIHSDYEKSLHKSDTESDNMPYSPPDISSIRAVNVAASDANDSSSILLVASPPPPRASSPQPPPPKRATWVGVPTAHDPKLLLCLSPSQRQHIQDNQSSSSRSDNAEILLDLHRKYIERRGYDESNNTSVDTPGNGTQSRLLAIIRETPQSVASPTRTETSNAAYASSCPTPTDANMSFDRDLFDTGIDADYPSFESERRSKQLRCPKLASSDFPEETERRHPYYRGVKSTAMSRLNKRMSTGDERRLSAQNLSEWMHHARNKSTGDLSSDAKNLMEHSYVSAPKVRNIPIEIQHRPVNKSIGGKHGGSHDALHNLDSSESFKHTEYNKNLKFNRQRRYSLPKDIHERQMKYILEMEKEIQREIDELEREKERLYMEESTTKPKSTSKTTDADDYRISRNGDIAISNKEYEMTRTTTQRPKSMPVSYTIEETIRQEMYSEYMSKVAERKDRKHHKVIKISRPTSLQDTVSAPEFNEVQHVCKIENEFMDKVKERKDKLGIKDNEIESGNESHSPQPDRETNPSVRVLEGQDLADVRRLPRHLQEFMEFTAETSGVEDEGVWSPNKSSDSEKRSEKHRTNEPPRTLRVTIKEDERNIPPAPPAPPVWTPRSAGPSPTAERKEFRPVNFESPVLGRRNKPKEEPTTPDSSVPVTPPWNQEAAATTITTSLDRRLTTSHSAPTTGLNTLAGTRLPRAQNPTITLLQRAREGQLPRGASYLEENPKVPKDTKPGIISPNEIIYTVKNEYTKEPKTEQDRPQKMADLGPRKFEGIGPTTKDGMPIVLRSEVKENNQAKWYRRMYDTLHRNKNDDFVTVRYKTRRVHWPPGHYPYQSGNGYLSEPEPNAGGYDSDAAVRYSTLDRRRAPSAGVAMDQSATMPRPSRSHVRNANEVYKNQPGRIEDYIPGHSSIADKEAKESYSTPALNPSRSHIKWWDEVMDIFDGWLDDDSPLPHYSALVARAIQRTHLEQQRHVPSTHSKSYMSHALKESGYESDSQLVFRRRDDTALQLSPPEQRAAYRTLQAGGQPPLQGFRKPAPERPKEDSEMEYFPLSPTLTRIRVHKNKTNSHEVICYPVTSVPAPPAGVFSRYEHTSSFVHATPPTPPNRRSSRHNSTLRLYSNVRPSSHSPRRHEACFNTDADVSNVQFLKDRLTCKLSSSSAQNSTSRKTTADLGGDKRKPPTRSTSMSPVSRIASTGATRKCSERARTSRKAAPEINISCHRTSSPLNRLTKASDTLSRRTTPSPVAFGRTISTDRTFGSEKRKIDSLSRIKREGTPTRLSRSPELVSPKEVQKVLQNKVNGKGKITTIKTAKNLPPGTTVKSSTTLFSSARNGAKYVPRPDDKALRVTVAISARGKELLRTSTETPKCCKSLKSSTLSSSMKLGSPATPKGNIGKREPSPTLSTHSMRSRMKSAGSSLHSSCRSLSRDSKFSISSEDSKRSLKADSEHIRRTGGAMGPVIAKPFTILKAGTRLRDSVPLQIGGSGRKVKRENGDKDKKRIKKSKKEGNGSPKEIKIKPNVEKKKKNACAGRAAGNEIVKELKRMEGDVEDSNFGSFDNLITDEINHQHEIVRSDSFFQNLFLRNMPSPTPSIASSLYRNTSVLEKARMWNNLAYKSEPSLRTPLNIYLAHRRPVTDSKFRSLDREVPSRNISPHPAGHVASRITKFDGIYHFDDDDEEEFGSTVVYRARSPEINEYLKERSKSEPPPKTVLTETVRPHSPLVTRKASPDLPRKAISPSPVRSPSCRRILSARAAHQKHAGSLDERKYRTRSTGDVEKKTEVCELLSSAQSTSNLNLYNISNQQYPPYVSELVHTNRKSDRFKELNRFYESLERVDELERATSSSDSRPRRKDEEIIDFDRWKQVRAQERAEQELKQLYGKLKVAQKERDLLYRTHDADALRWKQERDRGLRIKEKSVENLKDHFKKLSLEESEREMSKRRELELQKDVYKPLWRGNSVVNLASSMVEKRNPPEQPLIQQKSRTRPEKITGMHGYHLSSRLWSSLSVEQVNLLKNQLTEIYSNGKVQKNTFKQEEPEDEYVITVPSTSKHVRTSPLTVRANSLLGKDQLLIPTTSKQESKRSMKAESISSIHTSPKSSKPSPKIDSRSVSQLTEGEKKRLSMNLSQEIMNKVSQKKQISSPVFLAKETRGAIAAASARLPTVDISSPRTCYSLEMSEDGNLSPTRRSAKGKSDFVLVLTSKHDTPAQKKEIRDVLDEWSQSKASQPEQDTSVPIDPAKRPSSTSETESASSETSNRTIIYLPKEDIKKKVDYFENVRNDQTTGSVIYHARDDPLVESAEKNDITKYEARVEPAAESTRKPYAELSFGRLVPSQSYADLKELYGEQNLYKIESKPQPPPEPGTTNQHIRSSSLPPERTNRTSRERMESNNSSVESIFRSRSVSPDPEKYWRAYLNLVKTGDVRKLADKFESIDDLIYPESQDESEIPRRIHSDPEITRNLLAQRGTDCKKITVKDSEMLDVGWMKNKYEVKQAGRGRSRTRRGRAVSPISRIPLRPEDRWMPHINVISKLASLKCQCRSATVPCRPTGRRLSKVLGHSTGEVEKLRYKFEELDRKMSLLGQMFTSTPDLHELRDIAPYLAAPWTAHQYPKREDNARSLSSPEQVSKQLAVPLKKERPRPKSASPPRPKQKPLSILKPHTSKGDLFADQPFDPSIHRPRYRYQPDAPRYPVSSWWPRLPLYAAKPTVTFKEPAVAPPPPPKGVPYTGDYSPESPRRYVDSEVTIHYRSPVRQEAKDTVPEDELARRQAEAMRRIYQEERRRKYLQELQDMNSRRHTDNFIPSQKSPISLNRYDDVISDLSYGSLKKRDRSPDPRLVARALFNFQGQSSREISFKKGDIIFVRRQIDRNWYEGEHNAMVGLFPFNYVEIISYDGVRANTTPRSKPTEGQARAKFNFIAQTNLELSLLKGELVHLTRRVDDNWFEGRIANRKGIFPVSYVDVLSDIGDRSQPPPVITSSKPVASPAAHSILSNGSLGGKQSMGAHHYTPSHPVTHHARPASAAPVTNMGQGGYSSLGRSGSKNSVHQTLHVDTHSEAVPYRALYKYRPQNSDELELAEGDTVFVLEKCDDGWFVGSSQRTGCFGTFPGNYVERL